MPATFDPTVVTNPFAQLGQVRLANSQMEAQRKERERVRRDQERARKRASASSFGSSLGSILAGGAALAFGGPAGMAFLGPAMAAGSAIGGPLIGGGDAPQMSPGQAMQIGLGAFQASQTLKAQELAEANRTAGQQLVQSFVPPAQPVPGDISTADPSQVGAMLVPQMQAASQGPITGAAVAAQGAADPVGMFAKSLQVQQMMQPKPPEMQIVGSHTTGYKRVPVHGPEEQVLAGAAKPQQTYDVTGTGGKKLATGVFLEEAQQVSSLFQGASISETPKTPVPAAKIKKTKLLSKQDKKDIGINESLIVQRKPDGTLIFKDGEKTVSRPFNALTPEVRFTAKRIAEASLAKLPAEQQTQANLDLFTDQAADSIIRQRLTTPRTELTAEGGSRSVPVLNVKNLEADQASLSKIISESAAQGKKVSLPQGVTPTPTDPAPVSPKTVTPTEAVRIESIRQGLRIIRDVRKRFIRPDGSIDRTLVATTFFSLPGTEGRQRGQELANALEAKLRADSGAAVKDSEIKRLMKTFLPDPLDSNEGIVSKFDRMDEFLSGALDVLSEGRVFGKKGGEFDFDSMSMIDIKKFDIDLLKTPRQLAAFKKRMAELKRPRQ